MAVLSESGAAMRRQWPFQGRCCGLLSVAITVVERVMKRRGKWWKPWKNEWNGKFFFAGTLNICCFLLVVSMGWIPISTWEMVVSPKLHYEMVVWVSRNEMTYVCTEEISQVITHSEFYTFLVWQTCRVKTQIHHRFITSGTIVKQLFQRPRYGWRCDLHDRDLKCRKMGETILPKYQS